MSRHLTGELRSSARDKRKETKPCDLGDGASAAVRPDSKTGGGGLKMSIQEAEAGPEGQSDGQKGEKGQLQPVKFGFNRRAFLSVTRVH